MAKRKLPEDNPNSAICDMLNELAEYEKNVNRSMPKFKIYKKASHAIGSHPTKITKGAEAKKLDGVGTKIADKIDEFITAGKLDKVEKIRADGKHVAMSLLTKVTGIGPAAARKLFEEGITCFDELKANLDKLNDHQKIGVKYFDDFNERIPRDEVAAIVELAGEGIRTVDARIHFLACGSYRREAATCGDVDILITHPDYTSESKECKSTNVLKLVVQQLYSTLLTDTISHGEFKYMGVCVLPPTDGTAHKHRRIDIRLLPSDQYYCGLLFSTGSDLFNQSMRLKCLEAGFTLNEYSLRKIGSTKVPGHPIEVRSEKEIFEFVGMEFVEPNNRKY